MLIGCWCCWGLYDYPLWSFMYEDYLTIIIHEFREPILNQPVLCTHLLRVLNIAQWAVSWRIFPFESLRKRPFDMEIHGYLLDDPQLVHVFNTCSIVYVVYFWVNDTDPGGKSSWNGAIPFTLGESRYSRNICWVSDWIDTNPLILYTWIQIIQRNHRF
jgi:hypothetical protein